MKYQNEYNICKDKKDFIQLVLSHYPNIKYSTANRRYYDYKIKKKYDIDEKQQLTHLHKLMLADAKMYKVKITREFLLKHGFSPYEINWLDERNEVVE